MSVAVSKRIKSATFRYTNDLFYIIRTDGVVPTIGIDEGSSTYSIALVFSKATVTNRTLIVRIEH